MMTKIAPERGGEDQGILRVEMSVPFSHTELWALRNFMADLGWSIEAEQIDRFFAGEDWDE